MGRAERITQAIKLHDRELFCERSEEGKLCVYRKSHRVEPYRLDDESVLYFVRPTPYFVFALTHNWRLTGMPVEWGIEPIMARLRAIDLWNRDVAGDIIQQELKEQESRERDLRNTTESFLLDFRKQFAKTFNDVNTSTLEKKDSRRLYDKMVV